MMQNNKFRLWMVIILVVGLLGNLSLWQSGTALAATGTTVLAVDGGVDHSLALRSDGTVWAWGYNGVGQLGDGTTTTRLTPVQVPGLTDMTAIVAGYHHSLALKSDGTVWAWGRADDGQLGIGQLSYGSSNYRSTPVQVLGLTGVTAISAGVWYSLAVKSDGTVWAWGDNINGQLGDGTTTRRYTPVQVSGLTGVTAISAGEYHSLAVKSDGSVWAWGQNGYGKLGDGSTTNRSTPVQVSGLTGVTAISAGGGHSLAVKSDHTVWAWGANSDGILGDGTTTHRSTPVQVSGLTGVTTISAGYSHSFAVKSDGTVWAWGSNSAGILGDGSPHNRSTPVQISGLTGVNAIFAGYQHSLAAKSDGTVWAWGGVSYGKLGTTNSSLPTQTLSSIATTGTTILAVDGGGDHSLALRSDGTVWAWGANESGQLGDGSSYSRYTPVRVSGLTGVTALSAGDYYSLAVKSDGTVWAWGGNWGNGSTPVQVSGLTGVTAIATGGNHSLAVKSDGTVWAWGENNYGQLGDGSDTNRSTPVQVSGLTDVTSISAGYNHSLAVKSDGTVWAWGKNDNGELIGGSNMFITAPVQVSGLLGVTTISAGSGYFLATKSDDTVWAWGRNDYGQLGNGSNSPTPITSPVQVSGLTDVVTISAGGGHSLAIKSDGTVWAWGIDDGTSPPHYTPVQAPGLTDVATISAGGGHSLAVKSDNTIWAWGWNNSGQLGTTNPSVPTRVLGFGAVTPTQSSIDLTASVTHVAAGSTFTTQVAIKDATDLYAEDVTVTYDPNLFSFVEAKLLHNGLKIYHQSETTPGTLRFITASQGAQHGINGSAPLLELTFQAKNVAGTAIIAPTSGLVANSQGAEATTAVSGVQITVGPYDADVNGDGRVSLADLAIAGYHHSMNKASWPVPKSDVDGNTIVDDFDLSAIVTSILSQP